MLLSVLIMGSAILVFSAISGYLMLERIKLSTFSVDSTKAIYAADAGIECELYNYNIHANLDCNSTSSANLNFSDPNLSVTTQVQNDANGNPQFIKSIGQYYEVKRAFLMGVSSSSQP